MSFEINEILELIKKKKLAQAEKKISKLIKKIKPNSNSWILDLDIRVSKWVKKN